MNRLIRFCLLASMLSSMGIHLVVLQTVAWASMITHFSRQESLETSLQKTFNGRHPCRLCLQVRKASPTGSSLGSFRSDDSTEGLLNAAVSPGATRVTVWALVPHIPSTSSDECSSDSPPPKTILL